MYEAVPDPYCYPGTRVLINRAGLIDQATLDAFEVEIITQRLNEPLPAGRLGVRHYCAVHRHLFGDVYLWAGKFRTVRIAKQGSAFCYPEHIDREMRGLFGQLRKQNHFRDLDPPAFAAKAAHFLAELNAIHPFREGNGLRKYRFWLPWLIAPRIHSTRRDSNPLRCCMRWCAASTATSGRFQD